MEQQYPQQSASSHRTSFSPIPASVRQPISCEPCRHRKIKCSRTRPFCDTCRRRGCINRCVYKGSRETDAALPQSSSNEELLNRINNLEQLLKQHTNVSLRPINGQINNSIPSPLDSCQTSQLSPESLVSEPSSQAALLSDQATSARHGVLTSTAQGDVRYEPRTSQWTSVLANTNLSIATPSLDDPDDSGMSSGFPFDSSPVSSIDEILSILPPIQQCDYLKNQYFSVFSPVRKHLHIHVRLLIISSFFIFCMIRLFTLSITDLSRIRLLPLCRGWQSCLYFFPWQLLVLRKTTQFYETLHEDETLVITFAC